jgi:hypothetical protein
VTVSLSPKRGSLPLAGPHLHDNTTEASMFKPTKKEDRRKELRKELLAAPKGRRKE